MNRGLDAGVYDPAVRQESVEETLEPWREVGAVLLPGALDRSLVADLARAAGERYRWIERTALRDRPPGVEAGLPRGWRFVPTASSLSLEALDEEAGLDVARTLATTRPLGGILASLHQGPFSIDLDHAWLRRQYAPDRYPRWHAPHGWHQDGALGHDFAADPTPDASGRGGLLPVVTCWIPLDPCGRDAPGLELIATRLDRLLAPAELTERAVSDAFGGADAWTPEMQPGDVLLMHGGTLHRTHVTAGMTGDRTSVELRVFAAGNVPPRLAGDRFTQPLGDEPDEPGSVRGSGP